VSDELQAPAALPEGYAKYIGDQAVPRAGLHTAEKREISLAPTGNLVRWSEFLATDPEVRVRFPALPHLLRSSGSGTGSTQRREYN
jgi:hypothetical protein